MKKEYYIRMIHNVGLRMDFIAQKIGVHPSRLSRWLHGLEGSKLNKSHEYKLDQLLSKYL